jgi:hypothetical protein
MNYTRVGEYEQHESNPFINKFLEEAPPVKKRIQFMGNNSKAAIAHQVYNPVTEVMEAEAVFMRYIRVDEEKFTKLYLSRFPQFWELGKPAIRVFGYIMSILQPNKDKILFDMDDCLKYTGYKQNNAVNSGLGDLLKQGLIARSKKSYWYFINPLLFFNGDRIMFADCYVKDKRKTKEIDDKQLDLFKHYGVGRGLETEEKIYLEKQMKGADDVLSKSEQSRKAVEKKNDVLIYDPESGEVLE